MKVQRVVHDGKRYIICFNSWSPHSFKQGAGIFLIHSARLK